MIRRYLCILLLAISATVFSHAQTPYEKTDAAAKNIPEKYTYSVDSLAAYIHKNFPGERDKIRAIYIWIIHNLKYNVYITFVPRDGAQDDKQEIENALKTREGVCRQFAMLFCYLAEKVGIPAYTVDGYNKAKGVLLPDPHEWCVAKVNTKWYLYDPTFDMGYVSNYQFISAPKVKHFQLSPQDFIQTHMPFDPMWQLMKRPYSYQEFDSGIMDRQRNVPVFQFTDSIVAYAYQNTLQRIKTSYGRAMKNGKTNRLVDYYLAVIKANIEIGHKSELYDNYKEALTNQNQAIRLINNFMEYRKAEFKPQKKEAEIKRTIEEAEEFILRADSLVDILRNAPPSQYETAISSLRQSIIKTATTIFNQKKFIETYYATKPSQRNALFRLR